MRLQGIFDMLGCVDPWGQDCKQGQLVAGTCTRAGRIPQLARGWLHVLQHLACRLEQYAVMQAVRCDASTSQQTRAIMGHVIASSTSLSGVCTVYLLL
jgi:hypothetical protein